MRFALLAGAVLAVIGLAAAAGAQSSGFDIIVTRQNGQDLVGAVAAA